jgi:hypothetical protein
VIHCVKYVRREISVSRRKSKPRNPP